jgi:hypothetical protein
MQIGGGEMFGNPRFEPDYEPELEKNALKTV